VGVALSVGLLGLSGCTTASSPEVGASRAAIEATAAALEAVATTASVETSGTIVEVPDLTGNTVEAARTVLGVAGLVLRVEEVPSSVPAAVPTVLGQDPAPGTIARSGSVVVVKTPSAAGKNATKRSNAARRVVCIDPGHQAHSNSRPEPVGPGASETRPRASGGVTGVSLGVPESEVVLQISMNLKARLEAAGMTVVMTRTTNDVDLSNAERAEIANQAGADLLVRVHADASADPGESGIRTYYPAPNAWTAPICSPSKQAAQAVQAALVHSTHAVDRGAAERADITCFNWVRMPAISVQCGLLSNPVEDKLLSSPHYQDRVAEALATGIADYLSRTEAR